MGLQKIPGDWKIRSSSNTFSIWVNPDANQLVKDSAALFFSKTVSYTGGQLLHDEDLYYSGKTFKTIDRTSHESLRVTYYFVPEKIGNDEFTGWRFSYNGPHRRLDTGNTKEPLFIDLPVETSRKEADSMLQSWGLNKQATTR